MAAAVYLHRTGLAPLVLERKERGGLLRNANLVENYLGFPGGIKGEDLVDRFSRQLDMFDIRVTKANIELIRNVRGSFHIKSDIGDFSARAVIVASGTRPKKELLRGSDSFLGSRIFDELVEMPLTKIAGKRIAVIGGGDAAFDYGLNLQSRGGDVTILSRSGPKCLSLLRARAETSGIDVVVGVAPELVKANPRGLLLQCRRGKNRVEFLTDFILTACGREPNDEILSPELRKRIGKASKIPETNVPGLYLAGDLVRGKHRQTGIAVGDGIRAAMLVEEYLLERGCRK